MSAELATDTLIAISRELETQSLNSVVAGFSFAAALSWMDLVYPLVGHRIHGDLPHLQACQEARRPRLRGHTLIPRGLVNIKKNIPVTIIMNI
jgi:hypothetical protein